MTVSELTTRTIAPIASSNKPVLVIMNNLHGGRPLWPAPVHGIGWRLWKMLEFFTGATDKEYIRVFDRICITDEVRWDMPAAKKNAPEVLARLSGRKRVIILGVDTLKALDLYTYPRYYRWIEGKLFKWMLIPHPSGRNVVYRDPIYTMITASLLAELYNEYRGGVL